MFLGSGKLHFVDRFPLTGSLEPQDVTALTFYSSLTCPALQHPAGKSDGSHPPVCFTCVWRHRRRRRRKTKKEKAPQLFWCDKSSVPTLAVTFEHQLPLIASLSCIADTAGWGAGGSQGSQEDMEQWSQAKKVKYSNIKIDNLDCLDPQHAKPNYINNIYPQAPPTTLFWGAFLIQD